jgi:AmmeMemoRadiSam system protein B
LDGCAVSGADVLETPIGDLKVDDELRQQILKLSSRFTIMKQKEDEEEHSGEMQYPFLAKVLEGRENISVLPVMCGSLSTGQEELFGKLFSEIIARPDVLTVVSSDFCHWGSRFSYRPQSDNGIPIHQFIEQLDRRGMDLIQMQQPGAFADYLKETRNTICGRHAIAVWLRAVTASSKMNIAISFVKYAQSSKAETIGDSSVSYAAAVAIAT